MNIRILINTFIKGNYVDIFKLTDIVLSANHIPHIRVDPKELLNINHY